MGGGPFALLLHSLHPLERACSQTKQAHFTVLVYLPCFSGERYEMAMHILVTEIMLELNHNFSLF